MCDRCEDYRREALKWEEGYLHLKAVASLERERGARTERARIIALLADTPIECD